MIQDAFHSRLLISVKLWFSLSNRIIKMEGIKIQLNSLLEEKKYIWKIKERKIN